MEYIRQCFVYIDRLLLGGNDIGSYTSIGLGPGNATQAPGDLQLDLVHSQIAFRHVVIKRHLEVFHKQEVFLLAIAQAFQQIKRFAFCRAAFFAAGHRRWMEAKTLVKDLPEGILVPHLPSFIKGFLIRFVSRHGRFDTQQEVFEPGSPGLAMAFFEENKFPQQVCIAQSMRAVWILPITGIGIMDSYTLKCRQYAEIIHGFPAPVGVDVEEGPARGAAAMQPIALALTARAGFVAIQYRRSLKALPELSLKILQVLDSALLEVLKTALGGAMAKQVLEELDAARPTQHLIIKQINGQAFHATAVLGALRDPGRKTGPGPFPTGLANPCFGPVLGNLHLQGRNIKNLSAVISDLFFPCKPALTMRALFQAVPFNMVGHGNQVQAMALMPFLTAGPLARLAAKAPGLLVPRVAGRRLRTIPAVSGALIFQLFDAGFRSMDARFKIKDNRVNQLLRFFGQSLDPVAKKPIQITRNHPGIYENFSNL